MPMRLLLTVAVFAATVGLCLAQASNTAQTDDKGTYLGLLFAPIPEAQFKKLQQLPRGQGVRVTQVLAHSPAAKADLQRDDLVLEYNNEKIRDCEHFARLIINDKPNRKAKLTVLRDGQEKSVEVTLELGPALRIAAPNKSIKETAEVAKGVAKPGGPATVCVSAMPIDEGKMKVTIEFYAEGTGRIRTVVCQGQPAEIDSEVEKLPQRERDAARNALERLRLLTNPKAPDRKP
jgi:PDZ domain